MRLSPCSFLAASLLTLLSSAQDSAPLQNPATPAPPAAQPVPIVMRFTPGTLIRVQLEKAIDTKKAQVGDQVLARTLDDLKSVPPGLTPKGCEIVGHIAEVTPHQGDTASTLRIVFDKMVLKNGSDMPLPAIIQAVGFPDDFNPATNADAINRMGGTPNDNRGVNGAPASPIGSPGGNPNMYEGQRMNIPHSGNNPDAKLPFNAVGPIGMSGVSLTATAPDSILTSKKKNVKLEQGMQMVLRTN